MQPAEPLDGYAGALPGEVIDEETYRSMQQMLERYRQAEQNARNAMVELNVDYGNQMLALNQEWQKAFMACPRSNR